MTLAAALRQIRTASGLSLRQLAAVAETSHATIAAYEQGRVAPSIDTLERIVRRAGFALDVEFEPRCRGTAPAPKGDELVAVLDLAAQFPARHAATLDAPVFGRAVAPPTAA